MSNNIDQQKRMALVEFRGQNSDPNIYSHHHDGTYGIHKKWGVVSFNITTYEERKILLAKRIADLQRMVDEDTLEDIPDEFQELLIQGGTVNDQYDAKVVDEFFINCNITANSDWCGIYSYDWHEADKVFQVKKKLEAAS